MPFYCAAQMPLRDNSYAKMGSLLDSILQRWFSSQ